MPSSTAFASQASSCPFCDIAFACPPTPPSLSQESLPSIQGNRNWEAHAGDATSSSSAPAHLVLSTKYVLAFLDIMPLTRGHVLLVTRDHFEKLDKLGVGVSQEIGTWLPILSRAVMRTIFGTESEDHQWNVVQNNGVRAAQQVSHVHFHIIPRPPLDSAPRAGSAAAATTSFVMFGRGQRDELDDEEGESLARAMRQEMMREISRVEQEEGIDLLGDSGNVASRSLSKPREQKI